MLLMFAAIAALLFGIGLGLSISEDKHFEERFDVDAEKPALKMATVRCWAGGLAGPVVDVEFYAGTWEVRSEGWATFIDPKTNERVFLTHGLCVLREKVGDRL
jgi:hypothetical protein